MPVVRGNTFIVHKGEKLSLDLVRRLLWNVLVGIVRPGEDRCLVLRVTAQNIKDAKAMICR